MLDLIKAKTDMELRTDTIGHFTSPTEDNIRDAVIYPDEGGREGDIVKLMSDDDNFISIWIGKRVIGHRLTLRTGSWKLESSEKFSSEIVVELMIGYLNGNFSKLDKLQWQRPLDKIFLDNITKLMNSTKTS